jgi:hypothetical protein
MTLATIVHTAPSPANSSAPAAHARVCLFGESLSGSVRRRATMIHVANSLADQRVRWATSSPASRPSPMSGSAAMVVPVGMVPTIVPIPATTVLAMPAPIMPAAPVRTPMSSVMPVGHRRSGQGRQADRGQSRQRNSLHVHSRRAFMRPARTSERTTRSIVPHMSRKLAMRASLGRQRKSFRPGQSIDRRDE